VESDQWLYSRTSRCLIAKVAGYSYMASLLAPRAPGGAEAAVHAARKFLADMEPCEA
jgi:hypothetical protein